MSKPFEQLVLDIPDDMFLSDNFANRAGQCCPATFAAIQNGESQGFFTTPPFEMLRWYKEVLGRIARTCQTSIGTVEAVVSIADAAQDAQTFKRVWNRFVYWCKHDNRPIDYDSLSEFWAAGEHS